MQTYKRYVVYLKSNGKIRRTLQSTSLDISLNHDPGIEAYIEGIAHVLDDYVKDGKVVPRPEMDIDITQTDTGVELARLPVPCVVSINCTDYPVESAVEDIVFDQPGKYYFQIEAWPYVIKEFTVEHQTS